MFRFVFFFLRSANSKKDGTTVYIRYPVSELLQRFHAQILLVAVVDIYNRRSPSIPLARLRMKEVWSVASIRCACRCESLLLAAGKAGKGDPTIPKMNPAPCTTSSECHTTTHAAHGRCDVIAKNKLPGTAVTKLLHVVTTTRTAVPHFFAVDVANSSVCPVVVVHASSQTFFSRLARIAIVSPTVLPTSSTTTQTLRVVASKTREQDHLILYGGARQRRRT